jgi:hypothetical protein
LWNTDRTVLTIWLDPGRIKRDLQPNLKLGAPLQSKEKYRLIVSKNWKDTEGRSLQKEYDWVFTTGPRDSLSPDPAKWKMDLPKVLSRDAVTVSCMETLDHFLLMESMHITGKNGEPVKGVFSVKQGDRSYSFIPDALWEAGNYSLVVASRLEDLAGNNLNRPFDRDVTKTKEPSTKEYHVRSFTIKK